MDLWAISDIMIFLGGDLINGISIRSFTGQTIQKLYYKQRPPYLMGKKMQCEFCSSMFVPKVSSQYFCSSRCQNKQWQKNNYGRQLEIWREAYWRNRKTKLEYVKEYSKQYPEVNKKATKKYSLTEKGKIAGRKRTKAYRARKLGATGSHNRREFLELILRFDNFCPACGKKFATKDFTEDHIVPLSCGGLDDISNIQPLCGSCNSRKRDQTKDYRAEEYGYHLL